MPTADKALTRWLLLDMIGRCDECGDPMGHSWVGLSGPGEGVRLCPRCHIQAVASVLLEREEEAAKEANP